MPPLKIFMVASELAPYAKTGGLADMVAGLSRALVELGHEVRILIPGYPSVATHAPARDVVTSLAVPERDSARTVTIERIQSSAVDTNLGAQPSVYVLRYDAYFGRRGLYQDGGQDYPDNVARFALFSRAALELAAHWDRTDSWVPDVIHAHDWQAALVPVYLKSLYGHRPFAVHARSLLTLHNVGYQGVFPAAQYPALGLDWSHFTPQGLEFYGSVNLLKGGVIYADRLTTVSPTYCEEIQTPEYGFGLEGVFRERRDRLVGIVNGIDLDVWNADTDPFLPATYSAADRRGKLLCKAALERECGLREQGGPLFAVVSRLVPQKGIDLVVAATPQLVAAGGQLVILGTGEVALESDVRGLAERFPGQVKSMIGFDEGFAHRIQAGADAFLVPSRYEPCGLTQLCSLRYGTIPIVRRTGGLADTVRGLSAGSPDAANGFVFDLATGEALAESVSAGIRVFQDKPQWDRLVENAMHSHVGWNSSAEKYAAVYGAMR